MSDSEPAAKETKRHVMTFLVASERALGNALDELGFAENDDRLVEYEGRLAFTTCSHEPDCDDLFALIAELSTRGETWELVSRIDFDGRDVTFHSLARHRPVEAVETALPEDTLDAEEAAMVHDIESEAGLAKLRKELRRLDPATLYVSVGAASEERVMARVVQRAPRRTIAIASGRDEASLRNAIRDILPTVMFDVTLRPPR
ncbi:MAG: hypothetical protein JO010_11860 [Alphaproteobacteria bacterium]|nr:hypothetical protein [Alphaproteobacteria bacterium]